MRSSNSEVQHLVCYPLGVSSTQPATISADEAPIDRPFQILALDGGGIKGVFSAAVLAALEEDTGATVAEHFDLITGTSTGGIIALALGMGLRPQEIVDFYTDYGPRIFHNGSSLRRRFQHWLLRKYSNTNLESALRDVFGEKRLWQSKKRLVISSYNLDDDDVYLFKTPHHLRLRRDWRTPVWQVALATSAAPTYFPVSTHVAGIRHVDGGIWANNPILVGIAEAVSMLNVSLDRMRVLSLGTTGDIVHRPEWLNLGGRLQWAANAVEVILRAQSQSATAIARHLLGPEQVVRLNPTVPPGVFQLDRLTKEALIARAHSQSRSLSSDFVTSFLGHRAEPYVPCYSDNGNSS